MNSKAFRQGLSHSLSIVLGYVPVAVTFGVLANHAGIPVWIAGLMSVFVYAGAAQFIAVEMIQQGAGIWLIGMTTLILNIRHALMSLAVIPHFPKTPAKWSLVLAHGLTDESFVLNSRLLPEIKTEEEKRWVMLGVNLGAYLSWVCFTILGGVLGDWLPTDFSGFQFAMLALFILLAAGTVNTRNYFTFILAGCLGIAFKYLLPGKLYLILSVMIAAALGAWLKMKYAGGTSDGI